MQISSVGLSGLAKMKFLVLMSCLLFGSCEIGRWSYYSAIIALEWADGKTEIINASYIRDTPTVIEIHALGGRKEAGIDTTYWVEASPGQFEPVSLDTLSASPDSVSYEKKYIKVEAREFYVSKAALRAYQIKEI